MLEIVKYETAELELGMFVSELDRPWLGTPFLLQGFRIDTDKELEQLRSVCKHVFVDLQQSDVKSSSSKGGGTPLKRKVSARELFSDRKLKVYRDRSTLNEELFTARTAVKNLSVSVNDVFNMARKGAALDVGQIRRAAEPMVESVSRNPDACIWLARLRQQDQYTYQHSVAASVWAVALGRQLGLPAEDLNSLAVGGLLFDVGKLRVDPDLLVSEAKLTGKELQEVQDHVKHGADMIADAGVSKDVRDMVMFHHERFDGSGYPNKLASNGIPVFARIAAIVDVFDAITTDRSYALGMSPSAAIKVLNEGRGTDFQAEIVDEFIQAIGIYPAGTLVELTSGEVAVVVSECRTRRLRPRVMLLLDRNKQPLPTATALDLRDAKTFDGGKPLDIVTSLKPGAHGIDISGLRP